MCEQHPAAQAGLGCEGDAGLVMFGPCPLGAPRVATAAQVGPGRRRGRPPLRLEHDIGRCKQRVQELRGTKGDMMASAECVACCGPPKRKGACSVRTRKENIARVKWDDTSMRHMAVVYVWKGVDVLLSSADMPMQGRAQTRGICVAGDYNIVGGFWFGDRGCLARHGTRSISPALERPLVVIEHSWNDFDHLQAMRSVGLRDYMSRQADPFDRKAVGLGLPGVRRGLMHVDVRRLESRAAQSGDGRPHAPHAGR